MKLTHYIIIGLCVVIALLLLFDKDPESDNAPLEAQIASREAAIHEMGRNYTALRTKMRQDSILFRDTITIVEKENVVLERTVVRLRNKPEVIKIIQENASIDTLIQTYDSLVSKKDEQIYIQAKYVTELQTDLAEVEHNFREQIALHVQNFEDQKQISNDYKKQLRKERRRSKLAKILIPIVGVLGFVGGSQL